MTISEERTRMTLRQRAEKLARPLVESRHAPEYSVAVLGLGSEQVAIRATELREIVPLPPVVSLPGTPEWIAGLIQVRGELVCAVDLARWFGITGQREPTFIAIVQGPQGPLGLLADRVVGFREVRVEEISSSSVAGDSTRPVMAITKDLVAILDIERLLESEGLVVGGSGR